MDSSARSSLDTRPDRVLLVSDWTVDPEIVVATAGRRDEHHRSAFAVVVPAWLHGIDWAGDPRASVPCAQRQVDAIDRLATATRLSLESATVGDCDPVTAILDALADRPAEEILLCAREPHLPLGPLGLTHRVQRLTGVPIHRIAIARRPIARALARRNGHCSFDAPQAA